MVSRGLVAQGGRSVAGCLLRGAWGIQKELRAAVRWVNTSLNEGKLSRWSIGGELTARIGAFSPQPMKVLLLNKGQHSVAAHATFVPHFELAMIVLEDSCVENVSSTGMAIDKLMYGKVDD
jgi:hypothetical protein